MSTRHAFTLIELTISVAMGALIVSVAMSGFRVASQTITLANHLSLQNAILRSAVVKANEEMDFWDSFDSRSDTAKQVLRTATAPNAAPFMAMNFNTPATVLDFNPAHPRMWWNGQLWSSNRANDGTNYQRRFGDYSLFGRQGMGTIKDPMGKTEKNGYDDLATLIGASSTEKDFSDSVRAVPTDRSWRHNILPYISDNLGYYAAFDYLPANFVYGYYDDNVPGIPGGTIGGIGDIPDEFGTPGVGPGRFRPNWHSGNKPLSKVEAGHDNGYIFTNVAPTANYPSTYPISHKASYNRNLAAFSSDTYPNRWEPFPVVSFANRLPALWPTTWMQVKVTYHWMDFRQQVLISQTDPSTGVGTSLVLYGLTTTLRGARRQRGLDIEPPDPDYP